MFGASKPLIARNGPLQVLLIGRLSKAKATEEATQLTLASSIEVAKQYLQSVYSGEMNIRVLAEQASGLPVERKTTNEADELIASGQVDVVIAEDLGRVFRNPIAQIGFVFRAVDHDTRVIFVADCIDTADDSWQTLLLMAVLRHGLAIPEQRRRTFRTVSFAFQKGGNVMKVKYGYRKVSAEEARRGDAGSPGLRMAKLPEATPVIRQLRDIVMTTRSWSAALDWLGREKVEPGPYVTSGRWSTNVIRDLLTDPILKGVRQRRRIIHDRSNEKGILTRKRNPNGPDECEWPELAHLTKEEFDSLQKVIAEITEENNNLDGKSHPRTGVARRKAFFPFQHAACSICGAIAYSYNDDELKCQNTRRKRAVGAEKCWNHLQTDCEIAREKILKWVVDELTGMPGFLPQFVEKVHECLASLNEGGGSALSALVAREQELKTQRARLKRLLRQMEDARAVAEELRDIDKELDQLIPAIETQKAAVSATPLEYGPAEVESNLFTSVLYLSRTSYEFGDLMRALLPRFDIVPVQEVFSGQVRPRAVLTLRVAGIDDVYEAKNVIDLFVPPQPIRIRELCVRLKAENSELSYQRLADRITDELEPVTKQAVKRCFDIERKLRGLGLDSPYQVLVEAPLNASRWRHRPD